MALTLAFPLQLLLNGALESEWTALCHSTQRYEQRLKLVAQIRALKGHGLLGSPATGLCRWGDLQPCRKSIRVERHRVRPNSAVTSGLTTK